MHIVETPVAETWLLWRETCSITRYRYTEVMFSFTILSVLLYHIRYDSVKKNEFDKVEHWKGWLGKAKTLSIRYRHWICWFLEARCTHWKLSFRVAPDRSTYRKFQPSCTEKSRKWTVGRIRRTNEFGEENSESRRIRISWIRMRRSKARPVQREAERCQIDLFRCCGKE